MGKPRELRKRLIIIKDKWWRRRELTNHRFYASYWFSKTREVLKMPFCRVGGTKTVQTGLWNCWSRLCVTGSASSGNSILHKSWGREEMSPLRRVVVSLRRGPSSLVPPCLVRSCPISRRSSSLLSKIAQIRQHHGKILSVGLPLLMAAAMTPNASPLARTITNHSWKSPCQDIEQRFGRGSRAGGGEHVGMQKSQRLNESYPEHTADLLRCEGPEVRLAWTCR